MAGPEVYAAERMPGGSGPVNKKVTRSKVPMSWTWTAVSNPFEGSAASDTGATLNKSAPKTQTATRNLRIDNDPPANPDPEPAMTGKVLHARSAGRKTPHVAPRRQSTLLHATSAAVSGGS